MGDSKKAILALPVWLFTASTAKLAETTLLSCALCGGPVLVSAKLRKALPRTPVLCWSCVLGRVNPDGLQVVLHRVVREELEEIGIPENIIDLLLTQIVRAIRRGLH